MYLKRYKTITKKIFVVIIAILLILRIIDLTPKDLKIYFIDVGQGDCSLIVSPTGKNILIDGGEGNSDKYDYGKNVVLPYLLDRGIQKVDYLIPSHCDSDHIGGLFAVIENLKVDKIFIGKQGEDSKQLQDLIRVAKQKKIEIIVLELETRINIDKYVYLDVLWPDSKNLISENVLNNNSLVIKMVYGEFSCLFTGDIEEIAENSIVKKYENTDALKSTILKVAHHGSKSSSTQEFLDMVQPKIALIGVGENNMFRTPECGSTGPPKRNTVVKYLEQICVVKLGSGSIKKDEF